MKMGITSHQEAENLVESLTAPDFVVDTETGMMSKKVHEVTSIGQHVDFEEEFKWKPGTVFLDHRAADLVDVACSIAGPISGHYPGPDGAPPALPTNTVTVTFAPGSPLGSELTGLAAGGIVMSFHGFGCLHAFAEAVVSVPRIDSTAGAVTLETRSLKMEDTVESLHFTFDFSPPTKTGADRRSLLETFKAEDLQVLPKQDFTIIGEGVNALVDEAHVEGDVPVAPGRPPNSRDGRIIRHV